MKFLIAVKMPSRRPASWVPPAGVYSPEVTEAAELAVADLGLEEGEHVTAIRFEYGRVEQGFTTRDGGWDREGIKDVHDDIASATGGSQSTISRDRRRNAFINPFGSHLTA